MKWSSRVARIGGIDIRIHATFVLLLAWWAVMYYRTLGPAGALRGIIFTLALFASVLLHELGHALAARHFGVPTRDITLLPIGGVARLERIPSDPRQELIVALAGPAVTLAIVAALGIVLGLLGRPFALDEDAIARGGQFALLAQLMWVNVSLFVFNLLPAFPMDGGRILRSALARRGDYVRATQAAARVGRAFALIFGIVGFLYNPFLVLIAIFVWIGATTEASAAQERSLLAGVDVGSLMVRDIRTLAPTDTLQTALEAILAGFQHDFPVVHDDVVVGLLSQADLLRGLAQRGPASLVAESMESRVPIASPDESAETALGRLRASGRSTLPVVSGGRLCGLLDTGSVAEFILVGMALHASDGQAPRGSPPRGIPSQGKAASA